MRRCGDGDTKSARGHWPMEGMVTQRCMDQALQGGRSRTRTHSNFVQNQPSQTPTLQPPGAVGSACLQNWSRRRNGAVTAIHCKPLGTSGCDWFRVKSLDLRPYTAQWRQGPACISGVGMMHRCNLHHAKYKWRLCISHKWALVPCCKLPVLQTGTGSCALAPVLQTYIGACALRLCCNLALAPVLQTGTHACPTTDTGSYALAPTLQQALTCPANWHQCLYCKMTIMPVLTTDTGWRLCCKLSLTPVLQSDINASF